MGDGRRHSTLPHGGGCTLKPFVATVYSMFTVGKNLCFYFNYNYNLSVYFCPLIYKHTICLGCLFSPCFSLISPFDPSFDPSFPVVTLITTSLIFINFVGAKV